MYTCSHPKETQRLNRRLKAMLLGLALACVQCTGGSGGGSGGSFEVVEFSATLQSPRIYLNDPIEIVFSEDVDPRTVFSGIYIYPSSGAGSRRAFGEYTVKGNRVTFTPQLPTNPALDDGGFLPDTEYTVCVPRPHDACSVYIQNSPGVRSMSGRGLNGTRTEHFLTVKVGGSSDAFRPERAPRRPEVVRATVADAVGVEQVLNPVVNLASGQAWQAGILSTLRAVPPTTMVPGTPTEVPSYRYVSSLLVETVTSPFDPAMDVASRDPLTVVLSGPNRTMVENEFRNRGGVLTLRDGSSPPVEASWAIDTNTSDEIVTLKGSGPDFDRIGFRTPPFTAEVSQGITRSVAPGDALQATEVRITFSEALNPFSVSLDNFALYRVTDGPGGLRYDPVPPASTLKGASRQAVTHEILNGRSTVTLRPLAGFPRSSPGEPATIVVFMRTLQEENSVDPARKNRGIRDLNEYPLAYPRRTGWIRTLDDGNDPVTVGYIHPLPYTGAGTPPENIQMAWAFQTRGDLEGLDAIVEDFDDDTHVSRTCRTTASWTRSGRAGLHSTFGYGGNGSDGDKTVTGAVTLDSDTRTPGPDGTVVWNFQRLIVTAQGVLTLKGKYPIRINAMRGMLFEGIVDASGMGGVSGPPGKASTAGRIPGGRGGPGGGAGADANTSPVLGALPQELRGGPGYPRAATCMDLNRSDNRLVGLESNCGGGFGGNRGTPSGVVLRDGCSGNGGGHETDGSPTDYNCGNIQMYGREYGLKWVVTTGTGSVGYLTGAAAGGAGGNAAISTGNPSPADDIVGGSGGGGGGGVEFQCAGSLEVNGSAALLARGGSGAAGFSTVVSASTVRGGWGGGGAGGSLWLSATSIMVEGGVTLDATGGIGNPNPSRPGWDGSGGLGYIIVRDRGGSPGIQSGATITPAAVSQRSLFDPPLNGKSEAYSAWYDPGVADPDWRFDASDPQTGLAMPGKDLEWLNEPVQGQTVTILFQGARHKDGGPDPDPTTWYPPGNTVENPCKNWETDLSKIRKQGDLRHLRFRILFDIGERDKGVSAPNEVAIGKIVIRY